MTGIYQPPNPPIGPDRASNASLLTDRAEVAAARRIISQGRVNAKPEFQQKPVRWTGPEQFAGYDERAAAYELFGEDL